MTLLEAIILGVIQGLTEFLPISSSGHLVLGQYVLDIKLKGNSFEIVTHLGTLVSVLCIFWKEILSLILDITDKNNRKYIFYLILGTIPAVIIGFGAKSYISELFESVHLVSIALMFTDLDIPGTIAIACVIPIKNAFLASICNELFFTFLEKNNIRPVTISAIDTN